METSDLVKRLNEIYFSDVKPAILKGDYNTAFIEMKAINDLVEVYRGEINSFIPWGFRYCLEVRLLLNRIKDRTLVEKDLEIFEAFAAQIKLPKTY